MTEKLRRFEPEDEWYPFEVPPCQDGANFCLRQHASTLEIPALVKELIIKSQKEKDNVTK